MGGFAFLRSESMPSGSGQPGKLRAGQAATRAFFGGDRPLCRAAERSEVVSIVGTDEEIDLGNRNHIKLGVASGARVDEVGSGRPRNSPSAGPYRIPDRPGSVL